MMNMTTLSYSHCCLPMTIVMISGGVVLNCFKRGKRGGEIFSQNQFQACSSHVLKAWQCCSLYAHCSFGRNLDCLLLVSLEHRCLGDNRHNWSLSRVTKSLQRVCEGNERQRNLQLWLNFRSTVRTLQNTTLVD